MISTLVLAGVIIGVGGAFGAMQLPYFKAKLAQNNPAATSPGTGKGYAQPTYDPPKVTDADYTRGPKDAKITFVEYSDLECPYCKRFHNVMQQVMKEFPNDVRWIYRHFPLNIHSKAPKESEAAECAGELGGNDGFWKFIDRIFEITQGNNQLDPKELENTAQTIGLSKDDFKKCLDSGKYAAKVKQQSDDAQVAGAEGTPFSMVYTQDGSKYPLKGYTDFAPLKAAIQQSLGIKADEAPSETKPK